MPNYFDPSTALPDPATYQFHGPFGMSMPTALGMQAAANRRETMAPFIQRAGQSDELALQKQQQDVGEYLGQSGVASREAKRQADTATDTQTALNAPLLGALKRGQTQQQIDVLPLKNEEERVNLALAVAQAKGKPAGEALTIMGSLYPQMQAAKSPFEKQAIHQQAIKMYQEKFPGMPVPQQLVNAGENVYHAAYSTMLHTAQHEQSMAEGAQKEAGATERTRITQQGETQRNEATLAASKTPEQILNRSIAQLKTVKSPEQRVQVEQQIDQANDQLAEKELDGKFGKLDPMGAFMLRVQAQQRAKELGLAPDQAAKQADDAVNQWLQTRDQQKEQILARRGVTMSYLRRKNPGLSDEKLKAAAQARGITIIE